MAVNLIFDSPVGKSDHVVITFQNNCYGIMCFQNKKIWYFNGYYLSLTNYLSKQDWSPISDDTKPVSREWEIVQYTIQSVVEQFVPKSISNGKTRAK